ncbi:flagellar biosynthesis protein FlhF [Mangrovitalea sediminis]|uniref:flagellar biosynthesis protein FlhF n=1 Tax=Mangrovitalea sediminis TaxID=1982043 RepID=UPI000BE57D83|nr:flagellar biosynthesis protein FlhF [Mangrovitalea sediminis]
MKVKRFIAPSMQQALRMVREEMGDDAVILSNRKVDGGVEIVTALNYDEGEARDRLGKEGVGATNAARLAELQAEQHRRLQAELDRSRHRIREVRERRTPAGPFDDFDVSLPEPVQAPRKSLPDNDALAEMRAEILSLKDMISRQGNMNEPQVAPAGRTVAKRLEERLTEFGLSPTLAATLARDHGRGRLDAGWKSALKTLAAGIHCEQRELAERGGIYALVGPTGSGKTTTIGKLAARYVLRYGPESIALVTTDRYRVAAHEQLFVFGRILNIPVRVVDESNSLDDILDELTDRRLVLIDTAGLTASDKGWDEQLHELAASRHAIKPYLVLAATSQPRIMKSTYHCYKMVNLAGCFMTKLDEALTLGEVLGFAMETRLPVAYYTDGQKIPQDLHQARSVPLVRLAIERLRAQHEQAAVANTGA